MYDLSHATSPYKNPDNHGMYNALEKGSLYYMRFNFAPPQQIKFRICFGVRTIDNGDVEIVGLTCRTKQELSGGSKDGTQAWYAHIATVGKTRWNEYRKNQVRNWIIY